MLNCQFFVSTGKIGHATLCPSMWTQLKAACIKSCTCTVKTGRGRNGGLQAMNTQTLRRTTGLMEKSLSPNWCGARETSRAALGRLGAVARFLSLFNCGKRGRWWGWAREHRGCWDRGRERERESEFSPHSTWDLSNALSVLLCLLRRCLVLSLCFRVLKYIYIYQQWYSFFFYFFQHKFS